MHNDIHYHGYIVALKVHDIVYCLAVMLRLRKYEGHWGRDELRVTRIVEEQQTVRLQCRLETTGEHVLLKFVTLKLVCQFSALRLHS